MTTPGPGPRSGDDTYALIDDALASLAERRGAWLGDDLTAITLIASPIDQAERFLPELVTSARLNGHTWDQIAAALATSPEQAPLRGRVPGRRHQVALRPLATQRARRSRPTRSSLAASPALAAAIGDEEGRRQWTKGPGRLHETHMKNPAQTRHPFGLTGHRSIDLSPARASRQHGPGSLCVAASHRARRPASLRILWPRRTRSK
jgi:hypothetical protein